MTGLLPPNAHAALADLAERVQALERAGQATTGQTFCLTAALNAASSGTTWTSSPWRSYPGRSRIDSCNVALTTALGEDLTVTVQLDGVATAVTGTIAAGGTGVQIPGGSLWVAPGHVLTVKLEAAGAVTPAATVQLWGRGPGGGGLVFPGSAGGGGSSDASYLYALGDLYAGDATENDGIWTAPVQWDGEFHTSGDGGITVDGGDNTLINLAADAIYSMSATLIADYRFNSIRGATFGPTGSVPWNTVASIGYIDASLLESAEDTGGDSPPVPSYYFPMVNVAWPGYASSPYSLVFNFGETSPAFGSPMTVVLSVHKVSDITGS